MIRRIFGLAVLISALATPLFAQTPITINMPKEDQTAANGDRGMVTLIKRCDSISQSASADGKYGVPCLDSTGRLYVNVNGSLTDANSLAVATLQATALATGAATECVIVSAVSTNATSCKASAGNFYGIDLYNTTTTVYYLRLYNLATAPTCSSATGFIRSIPIPPAAVSGQVGGAIRVLPVPVNYGTGIAYCLTASSSSTANDNAATGIFGSIVYK